MSRATKALLVALLALVPATVHAQAAAPTFYVFADTAGAAPVGDSVYLTWVFAKTSPTSLPSSGVLVNFDCRHDKVQRTAHVVYHPTGDSSTATGDVVADTTGWVPVSNRRLFDLICQVGPAHGPPA